METFFVSLCYHVQQDSVQPQSVTSHLKEETRRASTEALEEATYSDENPIFTDLDTEAHGRSDIFK